MKTFRMLMALAVMVVIIGATGAARATTMAGERTVAVGMAKPADTAPAKTVTPGKKSAEKKVAETKRSKKQEQAAKAADKPADTAVAPKAKASRKKLPGDKPLETGKNGGSRTARKKSA